MNTIINQKNLIFNIKMHKKLKMTRKFIVILCEITENNAQ